MKNKNLMRILRDRINNEYFKKYNISKKGNMAMYIKTIFWLSLFIGSYTWYLQGLSGIELVASIILIGISLVGIALNIMHDANHGAYSSKEWVNKTLGYTMNIPLGLTSAGWKVQHNIDHHNETNIYGRDGDIDGHGSIRLTPEAKHKAFHRWQHLYAWFLYAISTLFWVFIGDFIKFNRYCKREKISPKKQRKEWTILIVTKIIHIGLFIVLPILVGYVWWVVLLAFVGMHILVGLITTIVFQLAHAVPVTVMLQENTTKEPFLIHQLKTTANFAVNNKVVSWLLGGLNFQVEHHLMRNISHVHYPQIAPIVLELCEEYNLPYNDLGSFWAAIGSHYSQLKRLSRPG